MGENGQKMEKRKKGEKIEANGKMEKMGNFRQPAVARLRQLRPVGEIGRNW